MLIVFNLLLVLAAGAGAAQGPPREAASAPSDPEYLTTMPLGDLVPRTEERGGTREVDWLPPGASFDRARRMVTIERISGATDDEAPLRFINGLATCFGPCPGQGPAPIGRAPFQGRPAARAVIDMSARGASGQPSRAYALAVSGTRALHVVIVLIRGPRSPADERFAEDVLASLVLCTPASRLAACSPD